MEALEGAIRSILEDEARAAAMAREARALVEAEFDWQALAERLHAALSQRQLV
jgi:glycosyltransferase involved in cell wall biosynthesis